MSRLLDDLVSNQRNVSRNPYSQTLGCTPQGNIELMSKEEVLDFKPAARFEWADDQRPKQVKDASIAWDDALILLHRANPVGSHFRERQPVARRDGDSLATLSKHIEALSAQVKALIKDVGALKGKR